jgi:hypothetical protein
MDDLSLTILDITFNSINAKAKNIWITVDVKSSINLLMITIKDDGVGMSQEMLKKATDPFFTTRTTRKVGLGIPFLKQLTEITEGSFEIQSNIDQGTTIKATFTLNHIDLPPLGDMTETLYTLLIHQDAFDFTYIQTYNEHEICINKKDILDAISGTHPTDPHIAKAIKSYMDETIIQLKGDFL